MFQSTVLNYSRVWEELNMALECVDCCMTAMLYLTKVLEYKSILLCKCEIVAKYTIIQYKQSKKYDDSLYMKCKLPQLGNRHYQPLAKIYLACCHFNENVLTNLFFLNRKIIFLKIATKF